MPIATTIPTEKQLEETEIKLGLIMSEVDEFLGRVGFELEPEVRPSDQSAFARLSVFATSVLHDLEVVQRNAAQLQERAMLLFYVAGESNA